MKNKSVSDIFTECFLRDNHTCQDCGSKENLEMHHILPVSQGGDNNPENLKTVCRTCHMKNYKSIHFPKDKSRIIPHDQRIKVRSGYDKTKKKQALLHFPGSSLHDIDDYRFSNRLPSRNEAIRELVDLGLKSAK